MTYHAQEEDEMNTEDRALAILTVLDGYEPQVDADGFELRGLLVGCIAAVRQMVKPLLVAGLHTDTCGEDARDELTVVAAAMCDALKDYRILGGRFGDTAARIAAKSALSAMRRVRQTGRGDGTVALQFVLGAEPPVESGGLKCFLVHTRGEEGREAVIPAYYLNAFPLEYEECICKADTDHEDGCPTTGWFYDQSNFEYDNCYHKLSVEVISWALIPKAETLATIPVPAHEEGRK